MRRYAAGETIEPWVRVEDRIFTPENAAKYIDEAY
jgi:ribose transport system substrate-binding protein